MAKFAFHDVANIEKRGCIDKKQFRETLCELGYRDLVERDVDVVERIWALCGLDPY